MKTRGSFVLSLLLLFALLLSACAPAAPVQEEAAAAGGEEAVAGGPQAGGTLVIGLSSEIMTLDPADYRDRATETIIRNIVCHRYRGIEQIYWTAKTKTGHTGVYPGRI